jgi:hypothetical protein
MRRAGGSLVVAEQELQGHRRGELGRAAEAPVNPVEGPLQADHRGGGHVVGVDPAGPGAERGHRGGVLQQGGADLPRLLLDPLLAPPPGVRDRGHHLHEPGPREVGAAQERVAVRRHEHGHRPAALPGHRLGGRHVHRVDVGPFLPVHLDRDQAVVDQLGGVRVLEGLVRHHVAPVAGGVADRQHHRHVAPPGLRQRLPRPGPPVHRIVGVLQQVGARRVLQPVRHRPIVLPGRRRRVRTVGYELSLGRVSRDSGRPGRRGRRPRRGRRRRTRAASWSGRTARSTARPRPAR